jgi:two-component system, NtrC family, response regulator HydG
VDGIDDPQDAWRAPVPRAVQEQWEPTLETGATAVLGDWVLRWPDGAKPMIEGDEIVVGRSSSADVVLSDRYVSGRHLRLVVRDSFVVVEPLKSTNLPKIDGQRVELARKVVPGDAPLKIVVGKTELVLEVDG